VLWAHALGFGGHFLTESRRYSVTFGQLRAADPWVGRWMTPSSWS
jgi:Replication initiator protein, pSAM2